ncbi:MAG: RICIN domain-containing protein, partial [Acidobacteriaceae bacterium]|nr:RICIN domain-containing protein [Acidobacteriaceae bacterium]
NNASNGLPLKQWTYWGGSNQIFQLQTTADGYYTIHPTNSGQCVDVAGGQTNDGATVWQWSCWGGDNQKWSFIPVQ